MKQVLLVGFATLVGFGAACATRSTPSPVTAQVDTQAAGSAVGPYTECTASTMWNGRGRGLNNGDLAQTVRIPAGWTPIGGTQVGDGPAIIICR